MTFVPNVLLRRLYRKGSLRPLEEGIAFDLKNILGPGILNKIHFIKINEHLFKPNQIIIKTNGEDFKADKITPEAPMFFAFNQIGTLILKGKNCLIEGKNLIELELISREAGLINVTINDNVFFE